MNGLIAWMARHPVAANLLMLFIVIAGATSALTMKQEVFPLVELDVLEVRVAYPGAAPDEVEEAVVQKIEEQIEGIDGIDRVTGIAAEGAGVVRVELMRGVSAAAKLDEVKAAVDRITTFPEEAERPVIKELVTRQRVIELAVYGDAAEATLREMAYRIKDDLTATPGISLAQVARVRDYEISVEVPNATLRAYGLTLQDIAATLKRSSLDLPSGDLKTEGESILLRARGRNYDRADFERVVVVSSATGASVRLADIARIDDGFRDEDLIMRFNGKPAAFVQVFRVGEDKVLDVVARVDRYLDETVRPSLPPGLHVVVWRDDSVEFRNRMDLLLKNGSFGLALVLLALALFLDPSITFPPLIN